ncbi:MAG: tetratricopeptide repeat protein [Bacteroidales bacterium]|nr:tetratricopeptide repeat protein [Bacteroidales bacterium]
MIKRDKRKIGIVLLLFISLGFIFSCATDKDKWLNRNYHSITTQYNGYFNGNESFKSGVEQIESQHADNYTKILPVFKYGDKDVASSANNAMDVAIKKASIQISRHTMFIKGIERNRWIDNCWLLIGKAHFYKQHYEMAIQNFDFVIARYPNTITRHEAMLWKIRANNQRGKFAESEALFGVLKKIIDNNQTSNRVKRMFPLVHTDFFIQQGNYDGAIEPLKRAIKINRKKKIKVRALYILAQIHQDKNNLSVASDLYKKVIKMNPDYEMAFNAKINMARCFDVEGNSSRFIKKYLNKMLKDEKNKEYLDQVYFALAEVFLKEKNDLMAIKNLKKSVSTSTSNDNQKAISSLTLADIYFKREAYEQAQTYYDSAVIFLDKDYPNYEKIVTKKEILTNLVTNILIVQEEDSLQRLAAMSAGERMAVVRKIIDSIIEEERKQKEKENQQQMNSNIGFLEQESRTQNQQMQKSGTWYFDNPTARSLGYTEFQNKWGDRKLEDNWRLKSIGEIGIDGEAEVLDSLVLDSLEKLSKDLKDPNFYLQRIPLTEKQMTNSKKRMEDALYSIGYIYYHDLKDYDKSIEAYDSLLAKFPGGEKEPLTYYQLYQVYTSVGFADKAAFYRNLLIQKYPEHDYAQILNDPDYFRKKTEKENLIQTYYTNIYNLYKNKVYDDVILRCDSALNDKSFRPLYPRLSYLKALAYGNKGDKEKYIALLQEVVALYEESAEANYAKQALKYLQSERGATEPGDSAINKPADKIDYSIYKYQPKTNHLFVFVVNTEKTDIEIVKNNISDFNNEYFSLKEFSTKNNVFTSGLQMITVSNFKSSKEALEYYSVLQGRATFVKKAESGIEGYFPVSLSNYSIFYQDKSIEKYNKFFIDKYLSSE